MKRSILSIALAILLILAGLVLRRAYRAEDEVFHHSAEETYLLLSAGKTVEEVPSPGRPDEFRNVSLNCRSYAPVIRGNCLESFEDAPHKGVKYAEADFRLTTDGVLVASHDDRPGGDCGPVSTSSLAQLQECRLQDGRHVATLGDFLRQDFREFYLDMKDVNGRQPEKERRAIEVAIAGIEAMGKRERVVVLMYEPNAELCDLLQSRGIRSGVQIYRDEDRDPVETLREAAAHGMEVLSIHIDWISPELRGAASELGVWLLGWYTGQPAPERWREEFRLGTGGIKTGFCPQVAQAQSTP